jgi:hypothetical protein
MKNIYGLTFFLLLTTCAVAQKNFFEVPSADIIPAGKLFLQTQATISQEEINNSAGATYGLGYNAELGFTLNQWDFQRGKGIEHDPEHPEQRPDLLINAQKAFVITTAFSVSIGTRSGINGVGSSHDLSFADFNYALGRYELKHHTLVAGAYYANFAYEGEGNPVGFMCGVDVELFPDKLHWMADYTSGNSALSAFSTGLEAELFDHLGVSLGAQWPAPNADTDPAGIIQLSWDF